MLFQSYSDLPRVLLLGMPDIVYQFGRVARVQNLGLESIAANLDDIAEVTVANLAVLNGDMRQHITQLIEWTQPDVVGYSSMTFQYPTAIKIAALVKQLQPNVTNVLGGYHATLTPATILNETGAFDFVVRGEGELKMRLLLEQLFAGRNFQDVPGLSFRADGDIYHTASNGNLDLDSLKLPNRSAEIFSGFNVFGIPSALVETSRGCVQSCGFCCMREMYNRTFRAYPTARVVTDIGVAKAQGVKLIFMGDDNATSNKKACSRLEELCDSIISAGHNDIIYGVQASVKGIANNPGLVRKMAEAGFKLVFLGIESGSQETLDFHKKGYTQELTAQAIANLKHNGIISWGGYIVGNPHDKAEDVLAVHDHAEEVGVDFMSLHLLTPFPGTQLRTAMEAEGLVVHLDDWKRYTLNRAVMRTHHVWPDRLEDLLFQVKKQFYRSPKRLLDNPFVKEDPAYAAKFAAKSLLRFSGKRDEQWYARIPEI